MSEEKQQLTTSEAINEYYRLKDKYESGYYDKYVKPILKNNNTKKEKRIEYSRLPKPECINCKRNVGSIFSISLDNKEYLRKFVAKCGDLSDPCPLDIQINYSIREPFQNIIVDGFKNIEKIKLNIIKEKNNSLFFNNTTANIVHIFEKLTSELKSETENTGLVIETDILKNNNPAKASLLKKLIDEFGKGMIIPFKQMIQDFLDKNDELILNQAIKFYVEEMVPKLKEIQTLKYDVNFVEYDEDTNEYKLIQLPNSIENKEYWIEREDKVLKFIKGIKGNKQGPLQTKELGQQTKELGSRTKILGKKLQLQNATEALEDTIEFNTPIINTLIKKTKKSTLDNRPKTKKNRQIQFVEVEPEQQQQEQQQEQQQQQQEQQEQPEQPEQPEQNLLSNNKI
jgi:DNA segregation ATPase FtsK/SpoIIIE-like protein